MIPSVVATSAHSITLKEFSPVEMLVEYYYTWAEQQCVVETIAIE